MASLQEFTNLREISLADGEVNREKQDVREETKSQLPSEYENEHKLKSNSLKRFFRMPLKKKTGDNPVEADKEESTKGDTQLETEIQNSTQIGDASDYEVVKVNVEESKAEFKRFKLRFGGIKSTSENSESNEQDLPSSFSRLTLKSSISNYWNSVFKQKKSKKSSKSTEINEEQEVATSIGDVEISGDNDSNFEEKVETEEAEKTFVITPKDNTGISVVDEILSEKLHALKISDENVID